MTSCRFDRIHVKLGCLATFLIAYTETVYCFFDVQNPPHHFFNAHLLPEGQSQIAVSGSLKYAVSDRWELGTQAWGYIFQPPVFNLAIKHRMFTTERTLSSFNSHTFLLRTKNERNLVSMHGIVTTIAYGDSHGMSLGLMDGLLMSFSKDTHSSLHLVTPVFAWDTILHRRWAITLVIARPVYAFGQFESSESGEGSLQIDFTKQIKPAFGMLTTTLAWESFHLEFGIFSLSVERPLVTPYLNLFWRIGA
jgi:hypothetical protein